MIDQQKIKLTNFDDMHFDRLCVGHGWITLVYARVLLRGVGDDETGGGLLAPL